MTGTKRAKFDNAQQKAEALSRYVAYVETVKVQLAKLNEAAEDFFNVLPEDVHYGHVGNLGYVTDRLSEIMQFLSLPENE